MHVIDRFFENSADAVVGINKFQRVFLWNNASEQLFGMPFDQVREKKCCEVIAGHDLNGDICCKPDCPLFNKLLKRELVADYDMVIPGSERDLVVVNVGAFVTSEACRDNTDSIAFLVFRRVNSYRLIKRLAADLGIGVKGLKPCKYNLTTREMEILELTAKGLTTPRIAGKLFISDSTVRNHLKNVFSKLGVHSRAEAVGLALRHNFF